VKSSKVVNDNFQLSTICKAKKKIRGCSEGFSQNSFIDVAEAGEAKIK
jgi:hypothetical protein